MRMKMKKLTIFITLSFCLGLFSGCSQSEEIANRKIDSVKAEVISTNHDDQDYFTLMPIVTTTGKTTITNFVPIWNNIDYLSVKYKYQGKKYSTKTDDFTVKKYKGKPYIRIQKTDIGNKSAPIVLYTHDN